jgi:hypothetical protein
MDTTGSNIWMEKHFSFVSYTKSKHQNQFLKVKTFMGDVVFV